jgi:uncharacterized membrane protein
MPRGSDSLSVADKARGPRLAVVDVVRGTAIAAMIVYHAAFDLSANRLIAVDVLDSLPWKIFARSIAATFLLVVGVSLVLATRRGFNTAGFLRRLVILVGAAGLVSLGTWWFDPGTFVFFGILHEIALASVLALPFLLLPSWLVAAVAAAVIALPFFYAADPFNHPALWWVGLSSEPPVTVDYVPVFPWFGAVLAGVVVGRLLVAYGGRLAAWAADDPASRLAVLAGRWSLVIYLVHQPLLVGALALYGALVPPSAAVVRASFAGQCVAACTGEGRDTQACTVLCGCMFDHLYGTDLFRLKTLSDMTPEQEGRWATIVEACAGD